MAKLQVKLRQHSPIIHFQAEQEGATLRATEVKPKLDEFIIKEVFNNNYEKYKEYLIGYNEKKTENDFKDKKALDYKLKINCISQKRVIIIDEFPLYFGNMGQEKQKKFIFSDIVKLDFFSFNYTIIEYIKNYLADFFINNNFGTRQSKGFGSFYICEDDKIYKEKKLDYCINIRIDRKKTSQVNDYKLVFEKVELFYNSLRKGLNYNKLSPVIKKYFDGKGIKWDKQVIKDTYFSKNSKKRKEEDRLLVKDLFGLSKDEIWLEQKGHITKEDTRGKEKGITRFKSPIFFKPIRISSSNKHFEYKIYFKTLKINQEYLGTEFKIKNKGSGTLKLSIPDKFDFNDFFEYLIDNKDDIISEYLDQASNNKKTINELKKIYDLLNKI